MRRLARLATWLVLGSTGTVLARPPAPFEFDSSSAPSDKRDSFAAVGSASAPLEGEDFATAIRIAGLPFSSGGSTCGYRDDYTPECTFLTGAPDAVYAFTPAADVCVDVELCGSSYDTAVHVYEDALDHLVGCNDDACSLASRLPWLRFMAGHTYFIVVDGWSDFCGTYALEVHECPLPCPLEVPSGALPEGEPTCADGYYDRYNLGCNDFPYTFTELRCNPDGVAVLGSYGTYRYYSEEWRDTDWYQVAVETPTVLDYRAVGGAPTQIAILDGTRGCGEWGVVCGSVLAEACEPVACQAAVPPGTYWLFIATRYFEGIPCGTPYVLDLHGYPCPIVGVEPATWGLVKRRYR